MRSRLLFVCLAVLVTSQAHATDSFQVRLGGFFPSARGDFWRDTERLYTLTASDFYDGSLGITYQHAISDDFAVGFNADFYNSTVGSAERGYVDDWGAPIFHDTTLTLVPLMIDLRVTPGNRGGHGRHRYTENKSGVYFGGGIGLAYWQYEEIGDFVDDTGEFPEVYYDRFQEDGMALAAHAVAGVTVPIGDSGSLVFEGR